jgi:hypothetical protein
LVNLGGNDEIERRNAEKKLALRVLPNPANTFASVVFTLTSPSRVRISIFDTQGHLIKAIPFTSQLSSGTHKIPINGMEVLSFRRILLQV